MANKRIGRGYSWPPFEKGNQAARIHGGRSLVGIETEVQECAVEIRRALALAHRIAPEVLPEIEEAFAYGIEQAAEARAQWLRLRRAREGLEARLDAKGGHLLDTFRTDTEAGRSLAALRRHEQAQANRCSRWLSELGLTPASLSRVARDSGIAKAARARSAEAALAAHIEKHYGSQREVEA